MAKKANNSVIPVRHISIRVPWHDLGWDGRVCEKAKENGSCLILPRIRETRDDEKETRFAGKSIYDISPDDRPACINERGAFMAPFSFERKLEHPYVKTSELHKRLKETEFRHPPYSAAAIPFRWMNKDFAWDIAREVMLDVKPEYEPKEPEWLAKRPWVQAGHNQKELLDAFFNAVQKGESLCFFYAKHTPLADDDRRVLIGVGWVTSVGTPKPYENEERGGLDPFLWDVIVQHSIRPDFKDGFLLPYHAILEKALRDPVIDPSEYVAFAPDDRREEFSYAAEHVTHDAAIGALLACKVALEKAQGIVDDPCDRYLRWIDARLSELWKLRGPCPGLGAALSAFGFSHGNFLAYQLEKDLGENEDPWPRVADMIGKPDRLPKDLKKEITPVLQKKWKELRPERLALLKLLSRFELSNQQAARYYIQEVREKAGIKCSDAELLANPYLLYEFDRFADSGNDEEWPEPVSVGTVDRGLFPAPIVREKHPIPSPSELEGALDPRRVRAFSVECLEDAAREGNTLLPRRQVVTEIRDLALDPPCPVDGDLYDVIEGDLKPAVFPCSMADGSPALQLDRLTNHRDIIRKEIEKRARGKRHALKVDWRKVLADLLGKESTKDPDEIRAREEKTAALSELASSRFSVLIGPAGTGKTTVLAALCRQPTIRDGGVLLLAPTGKARVRLWQACGITAKTLAQFLAELKRYNGITGQYIAAEGDRFEGAKTVIVDEASMLTEEMLGALISSLKGVERMILGGDPRQLPPIGAGRPFVDIVRRLAPERVETRFPRISPGYSELTVRRRQVGEDPIDLQLADWFSGLPVPPGEDEVWSKIGADVELGRLRFVRWDDPEKLRETILRVLSEELELSGLDDRKTFELSLGGSSSGEYVYFNRGAGEKAEAWQILTPFRNLVYGARDINRLVQKGFRKAALDWAQESSRPPWRRMARITKARGPEEIVYGDKVINVRNHRRKYVYPKDSPIKYVANGEIGIVVGQFKSTRETWAGLPWLTKVEFSSQPGTVYDYKRADFKEESSPILELAYAITIHKAQGSEFRLTLLILPEKCRMLSRELLYTALTRQRDRVVVLHQGDPATLRDYASPKASETARRLTNLFQPPSSADADLFLEEGLIHRSGKGVPMRSKSEVIIADALTDAGIDADYERKFDGTDGTYRLPDFTIEDAASGMTYLWEHCGLLSDEKYRRRWEAKRKWYEEQGVRSREDGGGERASLIVTEDTLEGGINSQDIRKLVREIWG